MRFFNSVCESFAQVIDEAAREIGTGANKSIPARSLFEQSEMRV